MFKVKTQEEELAILKADNKTFSNTKKYLSGLIKTALDKFVLSEKIYKKLQTEIAKDIPVAAERFLKNKESHKKYKFSTYFTWYISQRINPLNPKKK